MKSRIWLAHDGRRSGDGFILVADDCVMVQIGRQANGLGDQWGWIGTARYWLRAAQLALRPMILSLGTGVAANDNDGGTAAGRTGSAAREFER